MRRPAGALWLIIRGFALLRRSLRERAGIRLRGLGFLLRRLRSDHEFTACGYRWFLDHRVASVYASVLSESFLEPETHAFLQFISRRAPRPFAFVDVGAHIGEMLLAVAGSAEVENIIAFEPHPVCASVCRRNLVLNGAARAEVHEMVVGDGSLQHYVIDDMNPAISGIRDDWQSATPRQQTVRLDDVLEPAGDAVLLVDVEGAELAVLQGGAKWIEQTRPLIIFEYHDETRQRFVLADVQNVLGPDYEIFRLRQDGWLDRHVASETWNCVAVDTTSAWEECCEGRMRYEGGTEHRRKAAQEIGT